MRDGIMSPVPAGSYHQDVFLFLNIGRDKGRYND